MQFGDIKLGVDTSPVVAIVHELHSRDINELIDSGSEKL
jgi:hypothetical protein